MTHQGKEFFRSSNRTLTSFSGTTVTSMTFICMIKGFCNGLSAGNKQFVFQKYKSNAHLLGFPLAVPTAQKVSKTPPSPQSFRVPHIYA